jgi:hypothetical protein
VEPLDYTAGKDPVPEQKSVPAIGSPGQVLLALHLQKTTTAPDELQVSLVHLRPAYLASSTKELCGS